MSIVEFNVDNDLTGTSLPSIFLAGPIERRKVGKRPTLLRWRDTATALLLEAHPFSDLAIFNPEWDTRPDGWAYEMQVEWEIAALRKATCILCWIPRQLPDLPAFTTNVEVGEWLNSVKLVVGAPPTAPHTRYIKYRRQRLDLPWYDTLEDCCTSAISIIGGKTDV